MGRTMKWTIKVIDDVVWNIDGPPPILTKEDWNELDSCVIQPPKNKIILYNLPTTDENIDKVLEGSKRVPPQKIVSNRPITAGLLLRALVKHFTRLNEQIIAEGREVAKTDPYYQEWANEWFDGDLDKALLSEAYGENTSLNAVYLRDDGTWELDVQKP